MTDKKEEQQPKKPLKQPPKEPPYNPFKVPITTEIETEKIIKQHDTTKKDLTKKDKK